MKIFTFLVVIFLTGLTVNAQIIYVHPDSTYATIQDGINAAVPGDTVLVSDGTYFESIIIQNKKPLVVASFFIMDGDSSHIYNTIIDGSQLQPPNQSVVRMTMVDTTTILAGFTIQNGRGSSITNILNGAGIRIYSSGAKIMHNRIVNNKLDGTRENVAVEGAGIACLNPSFEYIVLADNLFQNDTIITDGDHAYGAAGYIRNHAILRNNIVRDNYSRGYGICTPQGPGLVVDGLWNSQVDCQAYNNKFIHNVNEGDPGPGKWGGGFAAVRSTCRIQGNEFIGNESIGADENYCAGLGVVACLYKATINNNLFSENTGGIGAGLYIVGESDSIFVMNNTFTGNEALIAAAIYAEDGKTQIINNVFSGNHAVSGNGGAIQFKGTLTFPPTARLVNNTFIDNSASMMGGAIESYNMNLFLLNDIFWNNSSTEGGDLFVSSGNASVAYCDIDPAKTGGDVIFYDGNMLMDPLFCDTSMAVSQYSPCIDAGAESFVFPTNISVNAPAYDITGYPRPRGGLYDMGAYEVSGVGVKEHFTDINFDISPNPFTNTTNCRYRLLKEAHVTIQVYDLTGRKQMAMEYSQLPGEYTLPLNFERSGKGIYLLKVQINDEAIARKIISR